MESNLALHETSDCLIIGIAGASASGKSLIAHTVYEELKEELGEAKIAIISEDSYYQDQSHLEMSERIKTNYDHPNSLDHSLLSEHLQSLKNGKSVNIPQYCYTTHNRLPETTHVKPKKVIIIEGILLLSCSELRKLFDISLFMDTALDICLLRRLTRDVAERGRTMEAVIEQYQIQFARCLFNLLSLQNSMPILPPLTTCQKLKWTNSKPKGATYIISVSVNNRSLNK